jgi:hypothetical protein
MLHLHALVKNQLEAPGMAWNILAYYWGMSAFGLGPAYVDYMQSDAAQQDIAWHDPKNEGINRIIGYGRPLTIKERFDRAVNFYLYCYEQGMKTAVNPPFDEPPSPEDLIDSRMRMESKALGPDKLIQASTDAALKDRPDLRTLWEVGGKEQREQRAKSYNARVLDTLQHVAAEIKALTQLTDDQLSETGFIESGFIRGDFNVTVDMMDEVMSEEVQDKKLGECYLQHTPEGTTLILSGMLGSYYTLGHNLELAMYDPESKARLSSAHHAILHTWRQLDEIRKENK